MKAAMVAAARAASRSANPAGATQTVAAAGAAFRQAGPTSAGRHLTPETSGLTTDAPSGFAGNAPFGRVAAAASGVAIAAPVGLWRGSAAMLAALGGIDLSPVPLRTPTSAGAARVARRPSATGALSHDGVSALQVTEPGEPDEQMADRFADMALRLLSSSAGQASAQASAQTSAPGSARATAQAAPPTRSAGQASAAVPASTSAAHVAASASAAATAPALAPGTARMAASTATAARASAADNAVSSQQDLAADEPDHQAGDRQFHTDTPGDADPGGQADGDDDDALLQRLQTASVGRPLGAGLRQRIEPLLGIDLSRVRVHADGEAASLTAAFQARAFAHRSDLFFAPGEFQPASPAGLHLLLHELAHVAQHAGASASPVVARAPLTGRNTHTLIERILLDKDSSLIAEGVLPGGNRAGTSLDGIGFPDLMRSSAGNKVPWVRGQTADDGSLNYVPIKLPRMRKHPHDKVGKSAHEPTVDSGQHISGDFPAKVAVGEIKPVGLLASGLDKAGEGLAQAGNYLDGLPQFAQKTKDAGKTTTVPALSYLTREKGILPPAIDYNNFVADAANLKPDKPNLVFGNRRIWVYPLQRLPVFYYFDLPHPYAVSSYTSALDAVFSDLEGLRKRLGSKQQAPKVKLKARQGRRLRRRARTATRVARKTDWKAAHAAWEADRQAWDAGKAKPYLKTDAAKAVDEKAKVDRHLNLPLLSDLQGQDRSRRFRQVEWFSGTTGKVLGEIRFALAPVFDKIAPFFDWLKVKLGRLVGKLKKARSLSLSWAQVIFDAVLKALSTTVQEAVGLLFGMFQDCIGGMVDNFIEGFVRDLGEELAKPFADAKTAFLSWLGVDEATVGQLVADVESALQTYEAIVDAVMDTKRIVDEIRNYEYAIRGIVEVISCLSPPLVGCLWGLAAQLALPAMVDLAMTSDLFQNRVVRPLVKDLVKDILDEPFSRIVSASIQAIGLGKWAQDVPACKVRRIDIDKIVDQAVPAGHKLDDPALLSRRAGWAAQHEGEVLAQAAGRFVRQNGKPVTGAELKAMVERTQDLVPEAGRITDAVANATRPDGKVDFDRFSAWVNGMTAAKPHRRIGGNGSGDWTSDTGREPTKSERTTMLGGLDLAQIAGPRLADLVEDARNDEGAVNVDEFVRKAGKHLERQQIKRDIEAQAPQRPGVPRQVARPFVDSQGAAAGKGQMAALIDSLAKARLGADEAGKRIDAARNADGSVPVPAAQSAVDATDGATTAPSTGAPTTPGSVAPDKNNPAGPGGGQRLPDEPQRGQPPRHCTGPLCIEKRLSDDPPLGGIPPGGGFIFKF